MSTLQYEQQGPALVGAVPPPFDIQVQGQGFDVSISADGETMVTCSREGGGSEDPAGSIIVWARDGDDWIEDQVIPGPTDAFFSAIDISADGNTIVVGAERAYAEPVDDFFTEPGSAWIYTRDLSGDFNLHSEILGDRTAMALYGCAVSINNDGTRAVVGAVFDGLTEDLGNENIAGNAYIWHLNDDVWENVAVVQGSGYAGAFAGAWWGASVEISGDGDTVLNFGTVVGTVWVWVWNGSAWVEQATISELDSSMERTGLALSFDGDVAAIPFHNFSSATGKLSIWRRTAGVWTQSDTFTGAEAAAGSQFGSSTALSQDGTILAVGGHGHSSGLGALWMFRDTGSDWVQQGGAYAALDWDDSETVFFGFSVDVSEDADYVAVGGPNNVHPFPDDPDLDDLTIGASWVFVRIPFAVSFRARFPLPT